jgi:hypothetical protein
VEVNDAAAFVGLPNFLKFNGPEGPNGVKGAWLAALERIPECPEKGSLIERAHACLVSRSKTWKPDPDITRVLTVLAALRDGSGDGSRDGSRDGLREPSSILELELEARTGTGHSLPRGESGGPLSTGSSYGLGPARGPAAEQEVTWQHPGSPTGSSDDGFEDFWTAYPRKAAQGEARKAWRAAKVTREDLERMLAAIQKQKSSEEWQREGRRYIPHPANYIRGRRWTDEVGTEVRNRKRLDDAWDSPEAMETRF